MTDREPKGNIISTSRVERSDVIKDGKKIAEKELFFDESGTLYRVLIFKDMNDNHRYDILDGINDYKKGVLAKRTIFKRTQVINYTPDGQIRNIAKFSD